MSLKQHYLSGQTIFREGDKADCAFIVERGEVEIFVSRPDGQFSLARLGPGDMFGEMAIIDDTARSAAAKAVTDVALLVVSKAQFASRFEKADPILRMCVHFVLKHARDSIRRLKGMEAASPAGSPDHSRAIEAILLEHEMRASFDRGDFELHYQPIIDLQTKEFVGAEALMRWRHPERGMVSPAVFIPLAEDNEMIVDLSKWAIKAASREFANVLLPDGVPPFVSVNFSAVDFMQSDFVFGLENTLASSGLGPERLKMEITEGVLMEQPDEAEKALAALRDLGVSVAIDDFGTGYSSLSYLHKFPLDVMKIDQSFVRSMESVKANMELIRSIVGLAKNFDMKIVAEGIETQSQTDILREMGCDFGQGFLFSRPKPMKELLDEGVFVPKGIDFESAFGNMFG